jgi:DNA end-binding protein Ku
MRWPDEIRAPAELLPPLTEVSEEEIEGALALMEPMSREDPEGPEFEDAYTETMAKIIEAKREDRELPEVPGGPGSDAGADVRRRHRVGEDPPPAGTLRARG